MGMRKKLTSKFTIVYLILMCISGLMFVEARNVEAMRQRLNTQLSCIRLITSVIDKYAANLDFSSTLEKVLPGVVGVKSDKKTVGTGILYVAEKGYVLTAKHVAEYLDLKVDTIRINSKAVRISDIYLDSKDDFAVVIVDVNDPNYSCSYKELELSDKDVRVGQLVFSIGHPFGIHDSVSMGIVSNSKGRRVSTKNSKLEFRIQFDSSVNPGNSGGPLVNLNRKVIGIVTSTMMNGDSYNTGVNLAMSVDCIKKGLQRFEQYLMKKRRGEK